jgi:hypothetical protein
MAVNIVVIALGTCRETYPLPGSTANPLLLTYSLDLLQRRDHRATMRSLLHRELRKST